MIEELLKQAETLAGRPVEVEVTKDGKFIVLWMHFQAKPPPKADSPEEALRGFIDMMLKRGTNPDNLPAEDTDGIDANQRTTIDN